jgi:hypothetical protein
MLLKTAQNEVNVNQLNQQTQGRASNDSAFSLVNLVSLCDDRLTPKGQTIREGGGKVQKASSYHKTGIVRQTARGLYLMDKERKQK